MKKILGVLVVLAALAVFVGLYAGWWKPKPVRFGTPADIPHFAFTTNGTVAGFDVDLARAIADELERPLEVVVLPVDELIAAVETGGVHLAAANFRPDGESAGGAAFSEPVFDATTVAMVLEGQPLPESLEDRRGRRVAGQRGTPRYDLALELAGKEDARATDCSRRTVVDLLNAQTDVALVERQPAAALLEKFPEARAADIPFDPVRYVLALPPADPEWKQQIDGILAAMEADGRYKIILHRWFVANDPWAE